MILSKGNLFKSLIGVFFWLLTGHLNAQTTSRAAFMKMEESEKRAFLSNPSSVIQDLVNGKEWVEKSENNIIRVPYSRFYESSYERKMAILSKPEVYKVMPPTWKEPKHKIPYQELRALPAEKRDRIMKDTSRFEIVY